MLGWVTSRQIRDISAGPHGKPAPQANYPFCSPRCQDIDLNRWLSDSYRVPTDEAPAAPSKTDEEE